MAGKARLFQDRRAEELIVYSPDPSVHKHIDRGVLNSDKVVWDRVREDAVLAGNFAKFSQNPTMEHHLLSTGTNRLAEASPFDPVWESFSGRTIPRPMIPAGGAGKNARKTISTVRDAIRTAEVGLATQASSQQFCNPDHDRRNS